MDVQKPDGCSAGLVMEMEIHKSITTLPPASLVEARKDGDESGAEDEEDVQFTELIGH